MKCIICDITGRTINYDYALSESLHKIIGNDSLQLWIPRANRNATWINSLFSSVPYKYRNSSNSLVRLLKVLDTFIAYITIILRVIVQKPKVFHLQWFPFLSLGLRGGFFDTSFIRILKRLSPRTRFIYTIHNVCPHGMLEDERQLYNPTFSQALSLFDHFIVHTLNTKREVCEVFGLKDDDVSVIYHGVFTPNKTHFDPVSLNRNNIRIIMFGNQNWYKGTDVLIKSLDYLEDSVKKRVKVTICGAISQSYFMECKSYEKSVRIEWIPKFVDDNTLYERINEADIIVLPYRRISQSGVLLLALSTNRFIITSDLKNFKETLSGFPSDLFFESENPKDLARVISLYCEKRINEEEIHTTISTLNELYSWDSSANSTLLLYKRLNYVENSR